MTIRRKKTLLLILAFLILVAVAFFQIIFPLSCKVDYFKITKLTQSDFSMDQDAYNQAKNNGGSAVQLLTDHSVDFDHKDNFREITYYFTVNNRSLFYANEIEFKISRIDNYSGIFIWKSNSVVSQNVKRFGSDSFTCSVLVKSQGLSDKELQKAAKGVHFKISASMDVLGNKTQNVRLRF